MNIQQDFRELLKLLEDNSVKYLIVGGYAVAFHGFPRLTKDIDIFFENSRENAEKIFDCLVKFGFPENDLDVETFMTSGNIITFGVEPVRVEDHYG
jgi:predicted nucleotidyltransferase